MTPIVRGQRVRFYPTPGQQKLAERCFAQAVMVYNQGLHQLETAYQNKADLTVNQVRTAWTSFKRETGSWDDVPACVATQTLRHLWWAFQAFFVDIKAGRPARYPVPKKLGWRPSVTLQLDSRVTSNAKLWLREQLNMPGFGPCKVRGLRCNGTLPKTIALSRDSTGRYWLSFNQQIDSVEGIASAVPVGIDLGVTHFATLSTGEKIENPRHLNQSLQVVRRLSAALGRSQMGSTRREKRRRRLARLHSKIAEQRRDFLHKTSSALVFRFGLIALEDLNVSGLVQTGHRRLARNISDAGFSEFRRLLEYKSVWYGRSVLLCGRWDPTSQVCSSCGVRRDVNLTLRERHWTCASCGEPHDRDLNAARNVLSYALGKSVGVEDLSQRFGSPMKREPSNNFAAAGAISAQAPR